MLREIEINYYTRATPRITLTRLCYLRFNLLLRVDIYNEQQRIRRVNLNSKTPIERAIKVIKEIDNYQSRYTVNANNYITNLFITRYEIVEIYKQHLDILLLDYTYKTNRYNIPLLNIYSVTSNNKNITLRYAFLKNEQAKGSIKQSLDYIRKMFNNFKILLPRIIVYDRAQSLINALNNPSSRFKGVPYLLCRQHQNKCVLAQLQKDSYSFKGTYRINGQRINVEGVTKAFKVYLKLINAKTKDEFNKLLQKLYNYQDPYQRNFYYYLNATQFVYKDIYILAQTNRYLYFSNYITLRLEGAYASLKRQLQNSKYNILTFVRRLKLQQATLKVDYDTELSRLKASTIVIYTTNRFFGRVVIVITLYALSKMLLELRATHKIRRDP